MRRPRRNSHVLRRYRKLVLYRRIAEITIKHLGQDLFDNFFKSVRGNGYWHVESD